MASSLIIRVGAIWIGFYVALLKVSNLSLC